MTAERYDGHDWPATISVGPGWYGLRLPQEYGTIVEYVDVRSLQHNETRPSASQAPGALPASAMTRTPGAAAGKATTRGPSGASCEVGT